MKKSKGRARIPHNKGFVAVGLNARGMIAVGLKAKGIVSLGIAIHRRVIARYVIAWFAFNRYVCSRTFIRRMFFYRRICDWGNQFGDNARAMIALGDTEGAGNVFQKIGELSTQDITVVKQSLDMVVPAYLSWAKEIIMLFL